MMAGSAAVELVCDEAARGGWVLSVLLAARLDVISLGESCSELCLTGSLRGRPARNASVTPSTVNTQMRGRTPQSSAFRCITPNQTNPNVAAREYC